MIDEMMEWNIDIDMEFHNGGFKPKPKSMMEISLPVLVTESYSGFLELRDVFGQHQESSDASGVEIMFCDVPYSILAIKKRVGAASSNKSTLKAFYQEHRLLLPAGIRSRLRSRMSQAKTTTAHPLPLSYRDTKNAIEILNPWFLYTELLHQCRAEYDICYRSIDMLSTQSLDKDMLRELLVLLYGQKMMITAPDLYTEFHLFQSYFTAAFKGQPEQVWIDLKLMNAIYGHRNESDATVRPQCSQASLASESTIPLSNKTEKRVSTVLIEV